MGIFSNKFRTGSPIAHSKSNGRRKPHPGRWGTNRICHEMLASLVKISPEEAWKSPGRGEWCNAVKRAFEKYGGSKPTKTVELIPYCRAVLDAVWREERGWGPLISSLWANMSLTASVVAYKEAWISGSRRAGTAEQVCRPVIELQRHWNAQPRYFRYAKVRA